MVTHLVVGEGFSKDVHFYMAVVSPYITGFTATSPTIHPHWLREEKPHPHRARDLEVCHESITPPRIIYLRA